jgi:hypothetical protein
MKSALFVEANVAVNTKLTSKVPFLFGNFRVFKKCGQKRGQKRVISVWYGGKMFPSPPPSPTFPGKFFLGALFNTLKCP